MESSRACLVRPRFWHAGRPIGTASADTFADGLATRSAYAMTFPALRAGLAGFVTVSEAEIAEALAFSYAPRTTSRGAGAAASPVFSSSRRRCRERASHRPLRSNIDASTLRRVVTGEI